MGDKAGQIAFPGILNGRRDIYTPIDTITERNVLEEVNSAIVWHLLNVAEETYLYWYRRGLQPILDRTKERNSFVLNKIIKDAGYVERDAQGFRRNFSGCHE